MANGVLISGMAGGESTTRGFLDGWDPETGRKLWRTYTIPAPGEPGSETWPKGTDAWKVGGGPTWRSGSYDPELDLVYWGVGNAEPYDPRPRGALDSLYTSSVLAIRPKTGAIACHFQYTPNDVYDVDGNDEQVLADIRVNGQPRKVMIQANKNGFLYVVDRTDCSLDRGARPGQGELGVAHRPDHGPARADRRLQALPGRRGSRDLAVTRHQRRAHRVQSEHRPRSTPARGTRPASRSWRRHSRRSPAGTRRASPGVCRPSRRASRMATSSPSIR